MTRLEDALHNDLKALELLRDQLKVHGHLLKAEAKDRWRELEQKRDELMAELEKAKRAAEGPRQELEAAARRLGESLKAGYADILSVVKSDKQA